MNELSKLDMTNQTVSTHRDYRDITFYEDNSKITKVNLTADIPLIQHDECLEDVYDTKRLDGYFGLYNIATDQLLPTRPVSSTYQLVPHHELFNEQAKILSQSDLPLDNITVVDKLFDHQKPSYSGKDYDMHQKKLGMTKTYHNYYRYLLDLKLYLSD